MGAAAKWNTSVTGTYIDDVLWSTCIMMMFDSKPRQILYTVIILSADNGLYDC